MQQAYRFPFSRATLGDHPRGTRAAWVVRTRAMCYQKCTWVTLVGQSCFPRSCPPLAETQWTTRHLCGKGVERKA